MAHQSLVTWFVVAAAGVVVVACSTVTTGSGAPGGGGASGTQIASCKSSCDKMKFFKCNSAAEQARCYTECDAATASQIDIFTGCAGSSICDPACRTSIAPSQPAGGSGGTTGGGGASAASCDQGCSKLVECSFIKVGEKSICLSECAKSAYQYQIDCVVGTACAAITKECGNPVGGETGGPPPPSGTSGGTSGSSGGDAFEIMRCQSACDSLQFFSCIDATELSTCRGLCSSAAAAKRDSFTACGNGAGGDCTKGADCFAAFQ